ncbi:Tetratricopeptide repeat protein [Posidoniimonas polymericola]|uniref:Tetratricopeptide repeat protein n=1 Tax=Posidoniimonas polymericola TaxID=2528002 RepID=A0A5C5YQT4_9BACT|nr:tetratricopeptide repeat protein [Posidoniimonas polymericola]TWT77209.1 Tetratricopeptide repeat protein [Posidoniimonas polymericola]
MADNAPNTEDAEDAPQASRMQRLRQWSREHPKRTMLVGGLLGLTAVATMAGWLVLADMTSPHQMASVENALEALDRGEYEYAEDLVLQIQAAGVVAANDIGGPLFVLGSVKAARSAAEFSPELRRRGYLLAAGYLTKARDAGFPPGREHEGLYLLGKALIRSNQLKQGIRVLEEALHTEQNQIEDTHRLIAEAYYYSERPVYPLVLKHLDKALATPALEEPERSQAIILKSLSLAALDQFDEAAATLAQAEPEGGAARKLLVASQIEVQKLEHELTSLSPPAPAERDQRFADTLALLDKAWEADKLATRRGANNYFRALINRMQGDNTQALALLEEVHQTHGQEPEGVAAAVAEGQLYQELNEDELAVQKYRVALDSVNDPVSYRSELLPLAQLHTQIMAAHSSFTAQDKHHAAAELVERMHPVFSRNEQLEMKADTYAAWGTRLLERAGKEDWAAEKLREEGRAKLREAGVNYELLADARFATKRFTEHLWEASEAYFNGQSYTSALRVIRKYLKNEPQQRNALALLRLGQTLLAMDKPAGAIDAFNECIEFHPRDAATYSARLECARAYRDVKKPDEARALLDENLIGSTLTPQSPEWRDSKFELGRLLHAQQQYGDAIEHLEECILRYPDNPQTRLAQYLVAEAYRYAAEAPLRLYAEAKTVNERELNYKNVNRDLGAALDYYETVRREIALQSAWSSDDRTMIRNCYLFKGSVLFQLGVLEQDEAERSAGDGKQEVTAAHTAKAKEHLTAAVQAYSDLSAQFQDEPIILEVLVQISQCWRRLDDQVKARGQIVRALGLLDQMPRDMDFDSTTNLSRNEWTAMLTEMQSW